MRAAKSSLDARLKLLLTEKSEAIANAKDLDEQLSTTLREYHNQLTQAETQTLATKQNVERIADLEADKQRLAVALAEAETQVAYLRANFVEATSVGLFETRIADLTSRVEFERLQKSKHESTVNRQQDELERLEDRNAELQRTSARAAEAIALHRKERLADAERYNELKKLHDDVEHRYKRAVS